MKAILLLSAMLAIAACLPMPHDQEREKRSASDSDESFPRIYFPPYRNPFGIYPPIRNPFYPWYIYYPFPQPFFSSAAASPYTQNERKVRE
ncbi:follicular dendritic cell secreted peptide [Psammomys obesus]|uniref:follicular dendritic cell secreted peptide n=1 Tax=Psammomys obesus TaxID=48139 RepID=UPI002453046E|nr:follicular dendritic cell secreted peptide [Psammomys obesus]